jgi:site-specific DNA-methyltransferase (adenine-specific)
VELNKIYNEDCLEGMKRIADKSVDMILCDLPYGTTACKWDSIIPFEPLWEQYERVIKDNGAIVLTASQPFTSALIMSKPKMFRYEWIWEKASGSNFAILKYQPMKEHENILVFSKNTHQYYPIMQKRKGKGEERLNNGYKSNSPSSEVYDNIQVNRKGKEYDVLRNPSSVQYFNNRESSRGLHPTQKPIALFEYLIKTYTNECETVLDNCMGSGTTAIACMNTNRNFLGFELDENYHKIACERVAEWYNGKTTL